MVVVEMEDLQDPRQTSTQNMQSLASPLVEAVMKKLEK